MITVTPQSQESVNAVDELARLRAENAALKAAALAPKPSGQIRVSAKGAVSVYSLGVWPVTLYGSQWAKLITMMPAIQQFLKDNADKLAVKAPTKPKA